MRHDARAYLWDAHAAAGRILDFTRGRSLDDYFADEMLRSAVERQFEIIGEALSQLTKIAPAIAQRIPEVRQIIDFRNVLIHGYAGIDHRTVWRTIEDDLRKFRDDVALLMSELGGTP